jgi:hypothetical protein
VSDEKLAPNAQGTAPAATATTASAAGGSSPGGDLAGASDRSAATVQAELDLGGAWLVHEIGARGGPGRCLGPSIGATEREATLLARLLYPGHLAYVLLPWSTDRLKISCLTYQPK